MAKLDILKKVFGVIKGSNISDGSINNSSGKINDGGGALNNGDGALKEDTVDELAIKELSRDFAQALNDRDFEDMDGRAEYHLYTIDYLIKLIKKDDEQNTINIISENKIKSKYENCEFVSISFSEDLEQAEVVYKVGTCVLSAIDTYFKELNKKNGKKNKISEGTPFNTTYTLLVKKEKGTWKIDNFESKQDYSKMDASF